MILRRRLPHVLALLMAFASLLPAQTQARVTGTVTDNSGAVIAGASLEARNADTGILFKAATTPTGSYLFPALPPGWTAGADGLLHRPAVAGRGGGEIRPKHRREERGNHA